ncbi:MAG TPA: hypothetical protein PLA71_00880 [Saccharofermentans sp.]|nr:hypothetical protein [Saccharofermentans sp.]
MKFLNYYLERLMEGGNAVQASRINQENVQATLDDIYKRLLPTLGLTKDNVAVLGSTGKKKPGGSSGDIDLAIDMTKMVDKNKPTVKDIIDFIGDKSRKFTDQITPSYGFSIISIAWPIANIDGKQENQSVQLDLMLTDNLEFSTFAYYAPAEWESQWKGLYRNLLLISIIKQSKMEVIEKAFNAEGIEVPVEWKRFMFDMNAGLSKATQSIKGKKGISATVKTLNKETLTKDPQKILDYVFGPNKYKPSDVLTFDSLYSIVMDKDFIYADKRDKIMSDVVRGLISQGVPIPEGLEKYS